MWENFHLTIYFIIEKIIDFLILRFSSIVKAMKKKICVYGVSEQLSNQNNDWKWDKVSLENKTSSQVRPTVSNYIHADLVY